MGDRELNTLDQKLNEILNRLDKIESLFKGVNMEHINAKHVDSISDSIFITQLLNHLKQNLDPLNFHFPSAELKMLNENIKIINSALKYKTTAKPKVNWKDELRKKIRLETALKGSI